MHVGLIPELALLFFGFVYCWWKFTLEDAVLENQNPEIELHRVISSACKGLREDFTRLHGLFVATHPEMEPAVIALNIMEFGRGQISGIEQPSDADREFIEKVVGRIKIENDFGYQYCAYVSGCVLGWVSCGQLARENLDSALLIVQACTKELYP